MEKSYIQKITPFIDNMRVGQDGGSLSLEKFNIDDIIDYGTEIKVDTTKGDVLYNYLKGIDWTDPTKLVEGTLPILVAGEIGSKNCFVLAGMCLMDDAKHCFIFIDTLDGSGTTNIIYATDELVNPEDPSIIIKAGFNNVDDGVITLNNVEGTTGYICDDKLPLPIYHMSDEEIWNGIVFGK